MAQLSAQGFIIHAYTDARRNRVHVIGRLSDGRSFVASQPVPAPCVCIRRRDAERATAIFKQGGPPCTFAENGFVTFDGSPCLQLETSGKSDVEACIRLLKKGEIDIFGADTKGATAFLVKNGIRAGVGISGEYREGQGVDLVFADALIAPMHQARAPLSVLSIDIETDEAALTIRCVGLSMSVGRDGLAERRRILLFCGVWSGNEPPDPEIVVCPDEKSLLEALVHHVRTLDPDIITGWNIIDFDFPRLAQAFGRLHIPFALGRSLEPGRFFPAENEIVGGDVTVKRSASVFLPGRQVLDGLRLVRTGFQSYESYTLDAVAHDVLGRGKTVAATGLDKLAELDRLYAEEPLAFSRYCLQDADLVLDILEKKDLIKHTIERAALTGAGIDKAWTSVASFERVYAEGLYARGIMEPNLDRTRVVSGAAGGTVLDPVAGMFNTVAVFDFRSLYPSIIRTFNVDPLAYERGVGATNGAECIQAPNGAVFARTPGILPALIAEYFAERISAIDRGDDASAFVYKILMNSFYGVLGTPTCRYARTELAGAITSFGKLCLHFARDFFTGKGYRVLYGDTDSVFVQLIPDSEQPSLRETCAVLTADLNSALSVYIRESYNLESFIGIRFEKLYRRFFIPRLRSPGESVHSGEAGLTAISGADDERGRAKGYAGLIEHEDGQTEVEIKGMEAARSDYTPLARRFQRELLGLLFRDGDTAAAEAYILDQTTRLYTGELDAELIFKKKLRRTPESYTASTPPHIRVARAMGWTNRRGTVEYVITVNGPESVTMRHSPIDYYWYAVSQLLPLARSAGYAAGFDADAIIQMVPRNGQLEFKWK